VYNGKSFLIRKAFGVKLLKDTLLLLLVLLVLLLLRFGKSTSYEFS